MHKPDSITVLTGKVHFHRPSLEKPPTEFLGNLSSIPDHSARRTAHSHDSIRAFWSEIPFKSNRDKRYVSALLLKVDSIVCQKTFPGQCDSVDTQIVTFCAVIPIVEDPSSHLFFCEPE
jgi:hypothetical protein